MVEYNKKIISDNKIIILEKRLDLGSCSNKDLVFFTEDETLISRIDISLLNNEKITLDLNSLEISIESQSIDRNNQNIKDKVRNTIFSFTESRINKVSSIDLVIYMDLTMELQQLGFIITDKTREEVYLQILTDGNEYIISLLEEYLSLRDDISSIKYIKKQYKLAIDEINSLSDDDAEQLYEIESHFINQ
jgi:GH15 family glucan-1,4-alpha-glucosidase